MFDCAMVVNEVTPEVQQDADTFVVALFKVKMDQEICILVRLVKDEGKWKAI